MGARIDFFLLHFWCRHRLFFFAIFLASLPRLLSPAGSSHASVMAIAMPNRKALRNNRIGQITELRLSQIGEDRNHGFDLPPISHPLITGVSPFWFCFEIISQPS